MVSPVQLQQLCSRYSLSPIFFKYPGTDEIVVSLDGTYPGQGLDIHSSQEMKLWSENPDYLDPCHPWRPYIPSVSNEIPDEFRWIVLRLFRYEAYRMVTDRAPFQLTEKASVDVVRSVAKLSMILEEITQLFPRLSNSKFALPPPPTPELLRPKQDANSVEVTIRLAGLQALDIIGLCVFESYKHPEFPRPSSLDDILPWSRHALRGVVLDLENTTFDDLSTFIQHHVPVYYTHRHNNPGSFPPELVNAKDRDGDLEKSHRDAMSTRKATQAKARQERRVVRRANPSGSAPVQPGKKRYFLKHNNRFKQVSRNMFNGLPGESTTHHLPTGIVSILDLDEQPSDEEDFSDINPIPDMLFVRGQSSAGQSSHTRPSSFTIPFVCDDEPGWTSRIPSPPPRPTPYHQPAPQPQPSFARPQGRDSPTRTFISRARSPPRRSRSPRGARRPNNSRTHYPLHRSRSPRPYCRSRPPCYAPRRSRSPSPRPRISGPCDSPRSRPVHRDRRRSRSPDRRPPPVEDRLPAYQPPPFTDSSLCSANPVSIVESRVASSESSHEGRVPLIGVEAPLTHVQQIPEPNIALSNAPMDVVAIDEAMSTEDHSTSKVLDQEVADLGIMSSRHMARDPSMDIVAPEETISAEPCPISEGPSHEVVELGVTLSERVHEVPMDIVEPEETISVEICPISEGPHQDIVELGVMSSERTRELFMDVIVPEEATSAELRPTSKDPDREVAESGVTSSEFVHEPSTGVVAPKEATYAESSSTSKGPDQDIIELRVVSSELVHEPSTDVSAHEEVNSNTSCLAWLLKQFPQGYLDLPAPLTPLDTFTIPTNCVLRTPPRSECCVRLWVLEHPDDPLSGVIPSLLAGGFSFRILTPTPPVPIAIPSFSPLQRLNRRDPNIQLAYRTNLQAVLSRPNARRFLTYGGVLWRLALYYSEDLTSQDLVVSALSGPTIAASVVEPGFYDDEISDEEILTLLGTAVDGSTLWPPETVFYGSDRWIGRWTPDNESWFKQHQLRLSSHMADCFKTRRQWLRSGFQVRREVARNAIGSEGYARVTCLRYDAEFPLFNRNVLINL